MAGGATSRSARTSSAPDGRAGSSSESEKSEVGTVVDLRVDLEADLEFAVEFEGRGGLKAGALAFAGGIAEKMMKLCSV